MEINKEILSRYTPNIYEIWSHGDTLMEQIAYHIHLEDWISYHLSQIRGVDVMDIKVIDFLKGELAKV
jgi:glucose/mannose-6-phosphate isomerase